MKTVGALLSLALVPAALALPPSANFTYSPERPRPGETVVLEDMSVSPDAPFVGIVSRSWNFGDGSTGGDIRVTYHAFANAGDYTVVLTAKDSTGLPGQTIRTIAVRSPGPPTADFSFTVSGGLGLFQDLSTDPDDNVVTWVWDFGDGTRHAESTLLGQPITRVAQHQYPSPGSYVVTLTVEDAERNQSQKSQSVTVLSSVVPSVSPTITSAPTTAPPPLCSPFGVCPSNSPQPSKQPDECDINCKTLKWVFMFAIAVFVVIVIAALILRLGGR